MMIDQNMEFKSFKIGKRVILSCNQFFYTEKWFLDKEKCPKINPLLYLAQWHPISISIKL